MLEKDPFFSNFLRADFGRSVIHEDINGKENLLVTIGDSWTWGDSLFGINPRTKVDSPEERLSAVYGYHLKNLLVDYDWINIAYPGTANRWIVDSASRITEIVTNYKHIIISVGLTDIGRDLLHFELDFNENTAIKCESNYLNQLSLTCDNREDITLIVGRNFTDTFDENFNKVKNHLPKRWVDISNEHSKLNFEFSGKNHYLSYPNKNSEKISIETKEWLLSSVFPRAENMIKFLMECPLHYKIASKHPTEECHIFWAEYLYDYIFNKSQQEFVPR